MVEITVPHDEWIELISDVESKTYNVDNDDEVFLKRAGSKPGGAEDGILAWAGENLPFDFDEWDGSASLWARARGDSDATVRVTTGRYPRKQRRDQRTTSVIAEDVDTVEKTVSTTVSSGGGAERTDFAPPDGYVWDVIGLYARVPNPVGSTTGTHSLRINGENPGVGVSVGFTKAESNYDADLLFNRGVWETADSSQVPSTEAAQVAMMKGIRLDPENVLDITYGNATDADQSQTRTYKLRVRELRNA